MIVYHGSNVEVREPLILRDEKGRDFGYAFYVTNVQEQAEKMARRKKRFYNDEKAIVNAYEFDEDYSSLLYKNFDQANLEWLDFIIECRTKPNKKHQFDLVEGKIADDSVGETILDVIAGKMSRENAAEHLQFQKINHQLAFCTEKALKHLRFLYSYEVK